MTIKPQRIRDPVHNLIEFDTEDLERALWQVIQTEPFQRLRRVRQLGFSELVFPGATHTRFAHSLGVFHIARSLMRIIERHVRGSGGSYSRRNAEVALAAALLHDVGHGMFSHAFEAVGKEAKLVMAEHEHVSALLIRDSEIAGALQPLGKSFADEVATLVGQKGPGNLYDAVVSSQFDADRLDYMQRDSLMTGVRSSAVDPTWLMANLEVTAVPTGADGDQAGQIETLVLGPKAAQTAEGYFLSLFHLYPNVYLHKTTRGAEMLFAGLMRRLLKLQQDGHTDRSALPTNHPIRRFIEDPTLLAHAQALDDTVFWGVLPMLREAEDPEVARLAHALHARKLLRCVDVIQIVESEMPRKKGESATKHQGRIRLAVKNAEEGLKAWVAEHASEPARVFVDRYSRPLYKRYQDSDTPLNRVLIRGGSGKLQDMADFSPVIAAAQPFEICRAYIFRGDTEAQTVIQNIIRTSLRRRSP